MNVPSPYQVSWRPYCELHTNLFPNFGKIGHKKPNSSIFLQLTLHGAIREEINHTHKTFLRIEIKKL